MEIQIRTICEECNGVGDHQIFMCSSDCDKGYIYKWVEIPETVKSTREVRYIDFDGEQRWGCIDIVNPLYDQLKDLI